MKASSIIGLAAALSGLLVVTFAMAEDRGNDERLQPIANMQVQRAAHQATWLVSGHLLATGGCSTGCSTKHASAELYDPTSNTFSMIASMTSTRSSHSASVLADGRVLIAGGWSDRAVTNTAELFDPDTWRFNALGELQAARAGHAAITLTDGRVFLIGGERATGMPLASTEIFDPATAQFTMAASMQSPRNAHVAVRLADGRVLVTGGHRARGDVLKSAEIFDPRSGTFAPTGDMQFARHKHAAVLLNDGKVLIVGGSDNRDFEGRMTSTEIFDPATGMFTPGPDMHEPRHKLDNALVRLPSGQVLIAGGAARVERYDPTGNSFVMIDGSLGDGQMFSTATLLPDGDVLILGGYGDRIRVVDTAWRYTPAR